MPCARRSGRWSRWRAHLPERARLAPAHGHDERLVDEQDDLAGFDQLFRVDVAERLQNDEERVVVELDLRSLVALDRILDGELVEVELPAHALELFLGGLVEAEPNERPILLASVEGLTEL